MPRVLPPIILAIFVVTCLAPLSAQEKKETKTITFTKKAPSAGDFFGFLSKSESSSTREVTRNGEIDEPRKSLATTTINRVVTILATKAGVVTKARVIYKKAAQVRPSFGNRRGGRRRSGGEGAGQRASLSDLDGLTFNLDFSGAAPKVTNEKGEAVSESVAKLVLRRESKDGKFTGWGPDMMTVLGKSKVAIGETITLDKKRFGLLASAGQRFRGSRMGRGRRRRGGEAPTNAGKQPETLKASMILRGTKTVFGVECAEFEVLMEDQSSMESERMSRESSAKKTGTVLIGISNGWLYSSKFEGNNSSSMSGSRQDSDLEMESTTISKSSKQITYAKKKLEQ